MEKNQHYSVSVMRASYAFQVIKVMAKDEDEAKIKALDEAGDYEYSENHADYEVQEIRLTDEA